MKLNERGSTLVLVLIVVLVFSVLGLSVVGNAVGERKRVDVTEQDGQARVLAQSGISYFETQFEKFVETNSEVLNADYFLSFLDSFSEEPTALPLEGVDLSVKRDGFNLEVTSKGTVESRTKSVTARYRIGFDIDKPTFEIADFTEGGTAANFADDKILGLNLGLLGLGLLNPTGSDQKFYQVPHDDIIDARLLGPILGLGLGGDGFKVYKEKRIIATRAFTVLGLNLLGGTQSSLVNLNVLSLLENEDTNVLINGCSNVLTLLGIKINKYSDIEFKKFAVIGNTLIQQDRDGSGWASLTKDNGNNHRRFTFDEGLYVNRSLIIGGEQDRTGKPNKFKDFSRLMLRGNMVAMDNLNISYVDLLIGDKDSNESKFSDEDYSTFIYVHGNADIHDACIRPKNDNYDFGILTKGKLTINHYTGNSDCNTFYGLYYAEDGIDIRTNGKKMYVYGGLAGNVTVDGVPFTIENGRKYDPNTGQYTMGNLVYKVDTRYMEKLRNVKLVLRESPDK